jgi:protein involved in polysaccharide export with SLBB domain/capsular polysaccharide biosynthesis protein
LPFPGKQDRLGWTAHPISYGVRSKYGPSAISCHVLKAGPPTTRICSERLLTRISLLPMIDEDFTEDVYTLRRRPHSSHQRSESRNGKSGSNGHAASVDGEDDGASVGAEEPRSKKREPRERSQKRSRPRSEKKRREFPDTDPRRALPYYSAQPPSDDGGFKFPFDPLRLIAAIRRRWHWLALATLALALLGVIAGMVIVPYTVSVNLVRRDSPNAIRSQESGDQFRPRDYSDQTLFAAMKSGEILTRVAQQARTNVVLSAWGVTPGDIAKAISIKPSPNPDWVVLSVKGHTHLAAMAELANIYAREVANYTKEIQRRDSGEMNQFLTIKLTNEDQRIRVATADLRKFAQTPVGDFDKETDADLKRLNGYQEKLETRQTELETLDGKIAFRQAELGKQTPANTQLDAAKHRLEELKSQGKTDLHPDIQYQKSIIKNLEAMQQSAPQQPVVAVDSSPGLLSSSSYQQLADLRAQRPGLTNEIHELSGRIDKLSEKLSNSMEKGVLYAMAKGKLDSLKVARDSLIKQQRDAQTYADSAPGYFKVDEFNKVTVNNINFKTRWIKVLCIGVFAGMTGLLLSMLCVLVAEALDTTIKTAEDVTRVTGLPVLASLGNLTKMSAGAQVNWAFRTLTILKGKLSVSSNRALVCGIISSTHGEGRSTWVNLLVSAASQRGLRVLTVDTRPASMGPATRTPKTQEPTTQPEPKPEQSATEPQSNAIVPMEEPPLNEPNMTLTSSVLTTPSMVAEQLTGPNSQPVVHIPLPGWVWNLERRKQWKQALEHWRKIENLVIFVELPPACQPEAVLLSENVPQMLWLAGSGMADSTETAQQLETLRHAHCNLVGAVLNFAPAPVFNTRITRWFGRFAAFALLAGSLVVHAQERGANQAAFQKKAHVNAVKQLRKDLQPVGEEANSSEELKAKPSAEIKARKKGKPITPLDDPKQVQAPTETAQIEPSESNLDKAEKSESVGAAPAVEANEGASVSSNPLAFSAAVQKKRAAWQQKLTLGPGDAMDIHLYGNPSATRTNVFVGPDGRISYLQVHGLNAGGLTVEELRAKLDQELTPYYSVPKTIVVPVAFTSKKYYMLGKVAGKGVYVMDRPVTLIEAVARAKGLETGMYQANSVEIADLSHSFIVRNGQRLPLNFEKLFYDGDLSQNVVLEPEDYVYFASAAVSDIYVVGEVMNPGPIGFVPNASVVSAITDRGGFADRAYKKRVLVVRGSLSNPETFAVDVNGVLEARLQDFRLQPHDIVFVGRRPWWKVEEIADEAMGAFIEGAMTAWAGANVHPFIKHRLLPAIGD